MGPCFGPFLVAMRRRSNQKKRHLHHRCSALVRDDHRVSIQAGHPMRWSVWQSSAVLMFLASRTRAGASYRPFLLLYHSPNFACKWGSYLASIIIRFVSRIFASPSLAYTCLDLPTKIAYPVFHDFSSPPTCLHLPRLAYKDCIPCIP